ncbi:anti-sigma factor [Glutamicibacter sp. AOP38-B1-38]|uniref:anti-sigma factor n=1 Tax=Glutamicibacter sp. AOP38-B1-38 TaxID=3457680 RepID=UPI0040338B87
MNGSPSQHRDEPQDENLGLDLVSQVAHSSRAERSARPKRWIFAVIGLVIVVVLALVTFSLLNSETKSSKAAKADDVLTEVVELNSGGQATISTSKQENALGVELTALPPLDDSEQYVVWAVHEEGGISVVSKTSGEDAKGGLSPIDDVLAVHITVEGSEIPASPSEDTEASVDLPLGQSEEPAA